jgi:hypothetical protein
MPVVAAAVVAILVSLVWSALGWGLSVPVLVFAAVMALAAGLAARMAPGQSQSREVSASLVFVVVLLVALGARYQTARSDVPAPNREFWSQVELADEESLISEIADEVVREKEARGESIAWPEGMNAVDALLEEDYPPAIWSEARDRWTALTPDEQQARTRDRETRAKAVVAQRIADERSTELNGLGLGYWDYLAAVLAAGGAAFVVHRPVGQRG